LLGTPIAVIRVTIRIVKVSAYVQETWLETELVWINMATSILVLAEEPGRK